MTPVRTRSSSNPPAQEQPSCAGPASFLSRPPVFFKAFLLLTSLSPRLPVPWFHPRWVVSSLSPVQPLPSGSGIPASSSPPTASPEEPNPLLPAPISHLLGCLGQGGQGAPHLSPCTSTFQGLASPPLASHGIPSFPPRTWQWVTGVILERLKAPNLNLSSQNSFAG